MTGSKQAEPNNEKESISLYQRFLQFRDSRWKKMSKLIDKPREIIWIIIKVGLIGLIPALLIIFISSLQIWKLIKPFFSTSAWQYLNWWATVYPEPAAAFLAIYVAFAVEKRNKEKLFQKRVREIVPHIYIELIENSFLIREIERKANDIITFKLKQLKFRTQAWKIYSQEISKWQEVNVVPLIRIYSDLELINNWDTNPEMIPSEIHDAIKRAEVLIPDQISVYEEWYKKNKLAIEELKNVLTIYEGIAEEYTLESKVVNRIQRFLNDLPMSNTGS